MDSDKQISQPDSPIKIWAGDMPVNGVQDNSVNMADVMEVAKYFNSTGGDVRYVADYDLNKDNAINIVDIIIITRHFNTTTNSYPILN